MDVNFEVFKSTNPQGVKEADPETPKEHNQDNNSVFDIEIDSPLHSEHEQEEINNITKDVEGFAIEFGEDIEDIEFEEYENCECPSPDEEPSKKGVIQAVITKKDGSKVRIEYDENGKRNFLTERDQDGNIITRENYRDGKPFWKEEYSVTKDGRPYLTETTYDDEGKVVKTEGKVIK